MTAETPEQQVRAAVREQLAAGYDVFDAAGALAGVQAYATAEQRASEAVWLLKRVLPLVQRYADALVQLELEALGDDETGFEYREGVEQALKILKGEL